MFSVIGVIALIIAVFSTRLHGYRTMPISYSDLSSLSDVTYYGEAFLISFLNVTLPTVTLWPILQSIQIHLMSFF